MKTDYETIIIGGGISGLACARRLQDAGRDFLLISKELGGRIKYDEKTGINMGAGIVISDNKNILRYIGIKKQKSGLSIKDIAFCDERCVSAPEIIFKNLHNIPKILKPLYLMRKTYRHVKKVMERMPHESLKEILESDEFTAKLFSMPAVEFVEEHGLEEITRKYINPIIASTFFTTYENVSAFYFLANLAPAFSKIYTPDFTHTIQKMTEGFNEKILIDTVLKVEKKNGAFEVATHRNKFTADNVVFAAPEEALRGVYDLPKPAIQQPVHRFVIKGKRNPGYGKYKVIFNPERHDVFSISSEGDHDIVSAREEKPGLERYYESYEIVNHIHWTPATIIPKEVIDQNPEKGVYIASDYNLSALEYSFLTGLYAANRIIKDPRFGEMKRKETS